MEIYLICLAVALVGGLMLSRLTKLVHQANYRLGRFIEDHGYEAVPHYPAVPEGNGTVSEPVAEGKVPLPDFWGGYRIVPHHMEFWQGGPGRVHDRFMYSLQPDGSWSIERLQP